MLEAQQLLESEVKDTDIEETHSGFLRIKAVLAKVPVSRATWYSGVKSGKYPKPIRMSEGIVVWRAEDIDALCNQIEQHPVKAPPPRLPNTIKAAAACADQLTLRDHFAGLVMQGFAACDFQWPTAEAAAANAYKWADAMLKARKA